MSGFSKELITVREVVPEDKDFIYSTWLKGLYYGNAFFKEIDKETYFENYRQIISSILLRPTTKVRVAALKEDPSVIVSYAILDTIAGELTLHFVFTKKVWRKLGLARWLVPVDIKKVTHLTFVGRSLKPKAVRYNPFFT